MKRILFIVLAFISAKGLLAQGGIPVSQMTQCNNLVNNFLTTYNIPGATFALSKDGKIVYLRSFGFSDIAKTIPTQPHNLFRLASVSKPITAIAIMKLMQDGLLTMSSKVFGTGGILQNHPFISTATITDTRIYNITVQQLLEHTGGWNRNINCNPNPTLPYPYFFAGCDPINNPLTVTQQLGLPNPVTEEAYCKYMLQLGLNVAPGTAYNYSNIGYLYLGEIIKQLSGMSYEDYIKTNVLAPLGIYDMHIGKNLLSEKQEREVEYTGLGHTNLSVYGTGVQLPWEYGGMNINAMDAHGGWIATARDMVTLITAIDGFATKPDILTPTSINVMTTPSAVFANYAKGWQVNASNNWWHSGSVPGTATIIARRSNGYTWAVLLNKRNETNANFWSAFDGLPWNCIAATTTWPTHDFMLTPTVNAANISFSNVTPTSITVNWTNGNGANRLLAVRPTSPVNVFPLDGTDYTANENFGTAPVLGGTTKIVYNGTGNSAAITGLSAGTTYHFRVIEYNKSLATGNNSLYLLGKNGVNSQATSAALPVKLLNFTAKQSGEQITVQWSTAQEINTQKFTVQRSVNGTDFMNVTDIAAKGNPAVKNDYQYNDLAVQQLRSAGKLYYRLLIVDKDGSTEYSPVAIVGYKANQAFTISPNPAKDVIKIEAENISKVEVLSITGKRLLVQEVVSGTMVEINVSQLASGNYIIKLFAKDGSQQVKQLIIK